MLKRIEKIKKAIKKIETENEILFEKYKKANSETEFVLYGEIEKNNKLIDEMRKQLEIEILLSRV